MHHTKCYQTMLGMWFIALYSKYLITRQILNISIIHHFVGTNLEAVNNLYVTPYWIVKRDDILT